MLTSYILEPSLQDWYFPILQMALKPWEAAETMLGRQCVGDGCTGSSAQLLTTPGCGWQGSRMLGGMEKYKLPLSCLQIKELQAVKPSSLCLLPGQANLHPSIYLSPQHPVNEKCSVLM